MSAELPKGEHIRVEIDAGVLTLELHRPEVRNAMSLQTLTEIEAVFDAVKDRRDVRAIVLRGAGGNFCSGGDIKDMAMARGAKLVAGQPDPMAVVNRRFGAMISKVDRAPQAIVAVLEGAVLGGGFGLACVADVAIAKADAQFGLPETGLGVPPAQIAPFLVARLGPSRARWLALTGGRFDGHLAEGIGLVHVVVESDEELAQALASVLKQIKRCAPGAIAATKRIMLQVGAVDRDRLLDEASGLFAEAARGPEGMEGMMAFVQKRKPNWADE